MSAHAQRWFALMNDLHAVSEAMLRGNIGRAGTLAVRLGNKVEQFGRELRYQAELRRLGLDKKPPRRRNRRAIERGTHTTERAGR